MTEEELKALPPEPIETVEIVEPKPGKSASDEAAEKLTQQLQDSQAREKAARETADAERQARLAAEQRAREREQEATQYRGQVQSAEFNTITTALEGTARELEMAENEVARAMEAGEWAKVAKAQSTLSMAAARLANLEQAKINATPDATRVTGRVEAPQPPVQQADPVERFISGATPATQSWLRQNRQFIKTDHARGVVRLDGRVVAAHDEAEESGIRADTPEYFAFIEQRIRPAPVSEAATTTQPRQQQRSAPVSAPVSRGSSNGGQSSQRITLTRDQVEAAHIHGDPKKTEREREIDYWNNLKALEAEGRIGNYRH